jgi:ribosomal protein L37AE/L43A
MIIMKEKIWQCPRCKNHVQGYGATSRRDNKTMICSCCGTEEAIFDFTLHQAKQKGEIISDELVINERAWLEG